MNFKFSKNSFYKLIGLNSISIMLKIIMGLVSTKLSSIYIGLNGISTLENFRNFASFSDSINQLGLQNGIISHSASSKTKEQDKKVISTILFLLGLIGIVYILITLLLINVIQIKLFGNDNFENVILLYVFSVPFATIQFFYLSYFQGKQKHKKVLIINSSAYLINILFSLLLIINYQLIGAIIQITIVPIVLFLMNIFYIGKEEKLLGYFSRESIDVSLIKSLLGFSMMNVISGTLSPVSFILIRNLAESRIGLAEAGIWSAILKFSGFYLMFVSSFFSFYFFPKLARSNKYNNQDAVIKEYFVKFIPLVFLGLLMCFFLQKYIVAILYTDEFLPMLNYFYLQLIADAIKCLSLIFGYILLAKRSIVKFIVFEIISITSYLLLSYLFVDQLGLKGIYYSLILSLFIYLLIVFISYFYTRKKILAFNETYKNS